MVPHTDEKTWIETYVQIGKDLAGESFVDLPDIDVIHGQVVLQQHLRDGVSGTYVFAVKSKY